ACWSFFHCCFLTLVSGFAGVKAKTRVPSVSRPCNNHATTGRTRPMTRSIAHLGGRKTFFLPQLGYSVHSRDNTCHNLTLAERRDIRRRPRAARPNQRPRYQSAAAAAVSLREAFCRRAVS